MAYFKRNCCIAILVENGEFEGSPKAVALRRFDRKMSLFSTKSSYLRLPQGGICPTVGIV